jgi:hypothetical protein
MRPTWRRQPLVRCCKAAHTTLMTRQGVHKFQITSSAGCARQAPEFCRKIRRLHAPNIVQPGFHWHVVKDREPLYQRISQGNLVAYHFVGLSYAAVEGACPARSTVRFLLLQSHKMQQFCLMRLKWSRIQCTALADADAVLKDAMLMLARSPVPPAPA